MTKGQKLIVSMILTAPIILLGIQALFWAGLLWLASAVLRGSTRDQVRRLAVNALYSLDQLGNACLGGGPDETISSRAGRAISEDRCYGCKCLCWLLNKIDPDHCSKAVELADKREVIEL
jgi:hypothetical protein